MNELTVITVEDRCKIEDEYSKEMYIHPPPRPIPPPEEPSWIDTLILSAEEDYHIVWLIQLFGLVVLIIPIFICYRCNRDGIQHRMVMAEDSNKSVCCNKCEPAEGAKYILIYMVTMCLLLVIVRIRKMFAPLSINFAITSLVIGAVIFIEYLKRKRIVRFVSLLIIIVSTLVEISFWAGSLLYFLHKKEHEEAFSHPIASYFPLVMLIFSCITRCWFLSCFNSFYLEMKESPDEEPG